MESSLKNTPAMLSHVDRLTSQLVTRFLNITDLARIPTTSINQDADGEGPYVADRNQAATNTFRIEVETNALVRAAEDILTLTRQMKELWLFGQLNTLGESQVEQQTEKDAQAVVELVGKLLARRYSGMN